jgi:hypothetical protein
MSRRSATLALILVLAIAAPASSVPDVRITADNTPGSYTRYDGSTDPSTIGCSTGKRPQNEPTVAVDPANTSVVVAGSNDYCRQTVGGDVWVGYYRSVDGGVTWSHSLVPGYPGDTSAAGAASPTTGQCAAAGDPTQAFDADGRLFYAFICFNRTQPGNGSVYAATYENDGADYVRTVRIAAGTPSVWGLFQDKINLTTDLDTGNVYVVWGRYPGQSSNNVMYFARSTDHGQSFSRPIRVAPGLAEEQFGDVTVGPDGDVYVTFVTSAVQNPTQAAVWLIKSEDQGLSFTDPVKVAAIDPFDSDEFSGNGAPDCGDGPFACPTGLTFSRFASLSAVAADDDGVHVVWNGETATGQSKVFVRTSPDGLSWPDPAAQLDTVATGHQFWPDVSSAEGVLSVVFNDSRGDANYSPNLPPGNTAAGTNSGDVVNAFVAQSTDGGLSWAETQVSTDASNYGWETHGARRSPFWGDYIYISAVPGPAPGPDPVVYAVWTDSRDLVAGPDPRETGDDDDADGFDVSQPGCVYEPNDINAPSYTSPTIDDTCLSQGGLDENIYGTGV